MLIYKQTSLFRDYHLGFRLLFLSLQKFLYLPGDNILTLNFQINFNQPYHNTNKLFMSEENFSDDPQVLDHLAPEKYGSIAYSQLSFTPNRLKDSMLYYEASNLKKDQEKNSKIRQYKADNELLQDRVQQLRRQREGVQESLNHQINMYKRFLVQLEAKYEQKIKELQLDFSEQMQAVILDSEEKSKVVQAEKEKYQQEIQNLLIRNRELEGLLGGANKTIKQLSIQKQKLLNSEKSLTFQLTESKAFWKQQETEKQDQIDALHKKLFESEENWKTELHQSKLQRQRELDNAKREHLQYLGKLEQQKAGEDLVKNEELQQVTKTFNNEVERLNQQISDQQKILDGVQKQLNEQKQKMLQATRAYDKEINRLIYEKNKFANQAEVTKQKNIELLQREKQLLLHPLGLNIQIQKLKQLLLESSAQLERCKQELVFLDRERVKLLSQLGPSSYIERSRRDYYY